MYYMNILTVRIPDELQADLQEISSRQSVPMSDLLRESTGGMPTLAWA
jgi:predicted transcriptional regulator